MFLGQFYHNLDDKGRLTVPARFRDSLVSRGAYVMQGFEKNLMLFPASTFEVMSQHVNQMSVTDPRTRLLRRLIFSTADFVELDKAGRILIAQFLRQAASLDRDVVVVGNGDYVEIWSPENWDLQIQQLQDTDANAERFATLSLPADHPLGYVQNE